ncbi:MAG: OmpA family protein, partial [Candidatus Krumholzibacteria bacterium]|nr:OmpA family protein [Candidatus Krumholzibacteria bacterium]
ENLTEETSIDSILLVENLSHGLGYAGGSDSPSIEGNTLRWNLPSLGPGEKRQVVFRARVKAGQEWGRLVCSACVYGVTDLGERTSDGPAAASIQIIEGIFTRRGIIFGSVFEDTDGDGVRSEGEKGVPGASVFIEDGTYAVTDSSGLYSIPGVFEGTHVVRVDPATLPDSVAPADAGYFGLGAPGELLIDLAASGNRRADFPLEPCRIVSGGRASAALGGAASAVAGAEKDLATSGRVWVASRSRKATADLGDTAWAPPVGGDMTVGSGGAVPEDSTGSVAPVNLVKAPGARAYEALTISSAQFAPASAYLKEIPLSQVAALALWIMDHPGWKISIAGHTDSSPISTAEFPSNFELSLARARTVFQLLRMNGIPEERMDYTGYGSRAPVTSNATPEGRVKNRRVNITVIPSEGYTDGDPGLPEIINRSDKTTFSLADDAGICSDIVGPEEGRVYYTRDEIDVEILSPLASQVELYVNNIPVGQEKIGQKRIDVRGGTLGLIFYSVKITEGKNDILVVCREHGGRRSTCVRHVYLAGKPAGIIPERESISVPADGRTSPEIVFLVNDKAGLPVRDGIFVTVDGPADLLGGLDVNPHQAGIQVGTQNGRIVLTLPPARDSRREKVHVSLGDLSSGCRISYVSPLRDWFIFGFGEGELGYSSRTGSGSSYGSLDRVHDGLFAEGKIALYGQGEVRGGHLLTCALNTRPLREDRLFRKIEPDKYYPIYGDAGELRFNAASRSGTYLKLDHRRYTAMMGDFRTELGSTEFTRYHRSFNGLEGEARFERGTVKTFITRTDQVTYQEEIPADGTSGFYFLKNYPLIENSE